MTIYWWRKGLDEIEQNYIKLVFHVSQHSIRDYTMALLSEVIGARAIMT